MAFAHLWPIVSGFTALQLQQGKIQRIVNRLL